MAWLGFHAFLGMSFSYFGLVTATLLKAEIGARMLQDVFCLIGYHAGYALIPVLAFEQVSEA